MWTKRIEEEGKEEAGCDESVEWSLVRKYAEDSGLGRTT